MDLSLVIFDCDGVLIDSEAIACRTDAACLAEIGIAMPVEDILDRYLGISTEAMCRDLERLHGPRLPADFAETLRLRVAAAFETELAAIDGVAAAIDAVPGLRCVASSSTPERLRHSLTLTGLWDRFAPNVFSATQVARGKPAPDLFLFAAASMGADPSACLVIEDSVPGVQAAVAAGMRVVGFTGGGHCRPGHAGRLLAAGADAVAASMSQVPALAAEVSRSRRC